MADIAAESAAIAAYPRPRAILFDWDKTLVDNWDAITEALNAAFTAMGKPAMSPDEARLKIRKSARESFPELFGERSDEALEIFYNAFAKHHCSALKPMSGVQDVLEMLAAMDMPTGIVSNKTADYLRKEVSHLGWDDYFDVIVGAGEAAFDKPAADPILLALERARLGQGSPDIWYVGDNEMDMLSARNAGIMPVLVNTMALPESHFIEAGAVPELSFDDYESFIRLLKSWKT